MPSTIKLVIDDIVKYRFSSTACIAAAIALDNALWKNMSDLEKGMFSDMAANIEHLMTTTDESRFTLYDYMDAVINNPNRPWTDIAAEINQNAHGSTKTQETAMTKLIELTEDKRRTYEEEFG